MTPHLQKRVNSQFVLQGIPAGDVGQLESLHHSEHLCERPALLASVLCLLVKVVEFINEESMYLILELLQ